jgi:hypothetical protein
LRAGAFFRVAFFFVAVFFRVAVFLRVAVFFRAVVFLRAGAFLAVVFLRAVDFFAVRFFVAFLAPEDAFLAGLTMLAFRQRRALRVALAYEDAISIDDAFRAGAAG